MCSRRTKPSSGRRVARECAPGGARATMTSLSRYGEIKSLAARALPQACSTPVPSRREPNAHCNSPQRHIKHLAHFFFDGAGAKKKLSKRNAVFRGRRPHPPTFWKSWIKTFKKGLVRAHRHPLIYGVFILRLIFFILFVFRAERNEAHNKTAAPPMGGAAVCVCLQRQKIIRQSRYHRKWRR